MDFNAIVKLIYDARKIALDKTLKSRVDVKGEADFVTAVDTGISAFVKEGLKKIAPHVSFVTEEEPEHITSGERFILDPIDGTTNLMRSYNQSSIALGYYAQNEVKFGVVFNPFTGEMFFAIKGEGAYFYNARYGIQPLLKVGVENYKKNRLQVSAVLHRDAIVEFGAGSTNKGVVEESFAVAKEVFVNCMDLRRICSSALAICYIAAGKIEGYFERLIKPWDYAGASLILTEAGGKISAWDGDISFSQPSSVVAGNEDTYRYLRSILQNK